MARKTAAKIENAVKGVYFGQFDGDDWESQRPLSDGIPDSNEVFAGITLEGARYGLPFSVAIDLTSEKLRIGCNIHTTAQWRKISNRMTRDHSLAKETVAAYHRVCDFADQVFAKTAARRARIVGLKLELENSLGAFAGAFAKAAKVPDNDEVSE